MKDFIRVVGKQLTELEDNWFKTASIETEKVLIDLGTGDGRFVLDMARENADFLCIGIDAAIENMTKTSRVAAAKPKKGGVPNAFFLRGAAENLPGPFSGQIDFVSINYPWGSLMKIVSVPDVDEIKKIRQVCKPDAELSIFLNYSVFEDDDYLERLGLGDITKPADNDLLADRYAEAGFEIQERELFAGDPPFRTLWGAPFSAWF